jgi:nitrate/TMAO reductase-like tetraheme cytochrome c subunit
LEKILKLKEFWENRVLKFLENPKFIRISKRMAKILVFLFFFGLILTFIGVQYSAQPQFCKSCHIMLPYYNAWKTSTHNMVPCLECHYPPGVEKEIKGKFQALVSVVQYFTGSYGKGRPWVEISDASCLREGCHSRRLLTGVSKFGNILFNHTPHLTEMRRGLKLRCTSCHSQIVQREHMTVTKTTCFLCHFKKAEWKKELKDCNQCHGAPEETVEFLGVKFNHSESLKRGVSCEKCHFDVISGAGNVSKEKCFICHTEPDKLEKYNEVLLMHDNHVTNHKVDCLRCHDEIKHQFEEMAKTIETDCSSCHPNHHTAQKELYLGIGGHDVVAMPDPMFLTRVSCTGCHIEHLGEPLKGTTAFANPAACISCHGTKFGTILEQWKSQIGQMLSDIIPILNRAKAEILKKNTNDERFVQAESLVTQAQDNVNLVKMGQGVHNIKFSSQLLTTAYSMLSVALKATGSSYKPLEWKYSNVTFKSDCFSCHIDIATKVTTFQGKRFSHQPHLEKINYTCDNCHSNQRKHGEMILKISDCDNCHHSNKQLSCNTCHQKGPKEAIPFRGMNFVHNVHTKDNGISCTDCHSSKDKRFVIEEGFDCAGCHHPADKPCETCHILQQKVHSGDGVFNYPKTEGPMSVSVGCKECHTEIERGKNLEIIKTACDNCHGDNYSKFANQWQNETREKLNQLKSKIHELEKSGRFSSSVKEKLRIVEQDKSWGVHNPVLIKRILEDLEKEIK